MTEETTRQILVIAIAVISIAVVMQAIMSVVSAMAALKTKAMAQQIQERIGPLADNAMEVLNQTKGTVTLVNEKLQPILAEATTLAAQARSVMEKANDVASRGQIQAHRVDEVLTETMGRVRTQLDQVDETMHHVLRGVRSTSDHVHEGILSPIRQMNGLVNGVTTAVAFLLKGRTTVQRATQEDEMFI